MLKLVYYYVRLFYVTIIVFRCGGANIQQKHVFSRYPAGIYLLKINNRNTRVRCEIFPKLKIKIPERRLKALLKFIFPKVAQAQT